MKYGDHKISTNRRYRDPLSRIDVDKNSSVRHKTKILKATLSQSLGQIIVEVLKVLESPRPEDSERSI